jgi:hypothetical protein
LLVQADDFLVLKLSDDGLPIWQYNYGGNAADRGYDIKPTADGGFIAVGETGSYGRGGFDVFVIKIFADGSLEWAKTYGGSATDQAFAVAPTADGGYLIAGKTNSFGVGAFDGWVLKLDAHGNVDENCNIDYTPIVTVQKIEVSRDELLLSFEISADNLSYTFLVTEDSFSEIKYQCEVNR